MSNSRIVNLATLLFITALVVRVVAAQSETAWVTVAADEVGFSVLMPSKPEVKSEQSPIAGNSYQTSTYTTADAKSGLIYLVVAQEMPTITQALSAAKRMEQFMVGFKEGFGDKTKVELNYERDIELDGRYGRQYVFSYAETRGVVRAYDAGKRVYVLLALGGDEQNSGIARFMGSFKITAAPPPPSSTLPPKSQLP